MAGIAAAGSRIADVAEERSKFNLHEASPWKI